MKPERWQQIERLYNAALEREEGQRSAFLAEACGGDESLKRQVQSLLSHQSGAERSGGTPSLAQDLSRDQARSIVGRQIGSHRILSLLGAGGMGEVYRAKDTSLGREVAIKVLPQAFVYDQERLARFRHEAQL